MSSKRTARTALAMLAAALLLLCGPALSAQQETSAQPLGLTAAAEMAAYADSKVRQLGRDLADRLEALGFRGYLDGITLRLSGSAGGDITSPWSALADSAAADGSATLSAGVDLVPALSLTGKLSATGSVSGSTQAAPAPGATDTGGAQGSREGLSGSLELAWSPFADSTGDDREELQAEQTSADLQSAIAAAKYRGITALLDSVSAALQVELAARRQEVEEMTLRNVRVLHERDRATDEQLEAAEDAVRDAAQRLIRARLSAERALEALAHALGVAAADIALPGAAELEPEAAARRAAALLDGSDGDRDTIAAGLALTDLSVVTAELALRGARLDLAAARRFVPDVRITASVSSPTWAAGTRTPGAEMQPWSYEAGAEIVLSPAQWDGSAVSEAREDLAAAEDDYAYAGRLAQLDVRAALNELEFALSDIDAARDDLDSAEQDLVEAQFRHDRGEITLLGLEQAKLAVLAAEHEVTTARLAVVSRLAAIDHGQW